MDDVAELLAELDRLEQQLAMSRDHELRLAEEIDGLRERGEKVINTAADPYVWGGPNQADRIAARDGHIKELYAMGWNKKKIAELVGLTVQRVHQIIVRVA